MTSENAPRTDDRIRFLRGGRIHEIADFRPSQTLLEYLREDRRSTGTKEGCGEGDCGACTVVVGTRNGEAIIYRAVNSCIQLVGSLNGKELITVEDLATNGALNPVQDAMVRLHGSQCGFCTPGFVMALFALLHRPDREPLTRMRITDAIAGNLCRCTGYRSIVDAAFESCNDIPRDTFTARTKASAALLAKIDTSKGLFAGSQKRFFAAPSTEDDLADLYLKHPDATLVAGATDVGLWITKQLRDIEKIIYLGRVQGMNECSREDKTVRIGAACTYTDAFETLAAIDPDIGELLRRLSSDQIRNAGTVGGNIANGSPIGDMPPVLIALGASIELRKASNIRVIPVEDFFIDYGVQDRAPSEFIRAIHVPELEKSCVFRCYKIAKRFDQDISSVLGAFHFAIKDGEVAAARIAFGGMAATPKRAGKSELALKGVKLTTKADWEAALSALDEDFSPMTDHRASAGYRRQIARSLLEKALIEAGSPEYQTRLLGLREAAHA